MYFQSLIIVQGRGCVSELVIYPWDWKGRGKVSPDFKAISSIGDDIASLIPTQDETIHDLLHYKGASSYSRRGQAHDWFYAKTGCFQYLIEAGIGGDEGIQTSSVDFYNQVLQNNFYGLFYLLRRATGESLNSNVDQYGITGIVSDEFGNPIENVIYQVDELYSDILTPRKTDVFGRYRWLLSEDDNSNHISFMHWDYESLLAQNFNIGSSNITELNVELSSKEKHEVKFTLSDAPDALLVLKNEDGLIDSLLLSNGENIFNIPEGNYDCQISSTGYFPILLDKFVVEEDAVLAFNLGESAQSRIYTSSLGSMYTEGDLYAENLDVCIDYSGILNEYSFLKIDMAYELEWNNDSLLIYLSDASSPDYIYTDQNWEDRDYYIKLDEAVDYSNSNLRFCLITDDSFGYRGVKINQVYGLGASCLDAFACNYGFDGDCAYPEEGFDCDGNWLNISENVIVKDYKLSQNHPNPFNPSTTIDFSILNPSNISLSIYNINGKLIDKIIDNEYYDRGDFSIIYKPKNLPSGVYFYRVNNGNDVIVKKMIYLK